MTSDLNLGNYHVITSNSSFSNNKQLVSKQYVDDSINAIPAVDSSINAGTVAKLRYNYPTNYNLYQYKSNGDIVYSYINDDNKSNVYSTVEYHV